MGVVYFLLSIRSECIHMSYTLTLAGLLSILVLNLTTVVPPG